MIALKHMAFHSDYRQGFHWNVSAGLQAYDSALDRVRLSAGEFAAKVGAENVVSIVEHLQPRFAVVVWYREDRGAGAKPATVDEFFKVPSYR